MAYSPPIKVYYGPPNDPTNDIYRLVPAPVINISTIPNYVNDSIVGYDYIIRLNGTITALDLRTESNDYDIEALAARIEELNVIIHRNGGVLSVVGGAGNVIKARGGFLLNFTIDRSDNRWVNYAPYSAEFKFNEIDYIGCDSSDIIACTGLIYDSDKYNSSLIDISKYKISSFSDEWTFDVADESMNRYSSIHNESINITYTINANGKLFFNGDKVLPAWEQAKNFCQDRLYTQVINLIQNVLPKSNGTACSPPDTIDAIYSSGSSNNGIINLDNSTYGIYNETITCSASESEGSFNATYNAILKKQNTSSFSTNNAIHTFSVTRRVIDNNATKSIVIGVEGNIQGLIPGGLIRSPVPLSLPSSGKLFLVNDTVSSVSKYQYALDNYNKIVSNRDLIDDLKSELNITYTSLGLACTGGYPKNTIFNTDHSYANGSIGYSVEYNSVISCLDKTPIRNISITQNDPTPRIAEFIIPGRAAGPIIQRIGSDQPRTVTININGVNDKPYCCLDPEQIVTDVCGDIHNLIPSVGIPASGLPYMVTTEDSYTSNLIDGSFTIKREYICYDT